MPRPCQRRRESTAAQRKSKANPKSSGPPPIRHKARQKAIHNARHGRGRGGRPSQNQRSGNESVRNQDFIAFASTGNNFNVLHAAGSRIDPITFDDDDSSEPIDLVTDDGSDQEDTSELEEWDEAALTINVQAHQIDRKRPDRARIMFSEVEAIKVYKGLYKAGFPLSAPTRKRYEPVKDREGLVLPVMRSMVPVAYHGLPPDPRVSSTSAAPQQIQQSQLKISSNILAPSIAMSESVTHHVANLDSLVQRSGTSDAARNYVFDWGIHKGVPFSQAPESFLEATAKNPVLLDHHAGLREAFDYHRPGMRRTVPIKRRPDRVARQGKAPVAAPSKQGRVQGIRGNTDESWKNFRFPTGVNAGRRLNEVKENYLRSLEGMPHVMGKWPGLREALQDYNQRTGRQGKQA